MLLRCCCLSVFLGMDGAILLRTSQRKEENNFKESKFQVFVLGFVDVDPNYFCSYIFHFFLWLWRQELINSAIFTKFYFPKIVAIQEKTLAWVKVAFRQTSLPARDTFVADTNFVSGTQKCFEADHFFVVFLQMCFFLKKHQKNSQRQIIIALCNFCHLVIINYACFA